MLPDPALCYRGIEEIISCGKQAGQSGLVDGFSGNLSVRLPGNIFLITAAGTVKSALEPEDIVLISPSAASQGKRPSSEAALHLAIYNAYPGCCAIAHTHPPDMQALGKDNQSLARHFRRLRLYEAEVWRKKILLVTAMPPGLPELASGCVAAMRTAWGDALPMPCGIWLNQHGLVACALTLKQSIACSSELNHLAHICILRKTMD